MKRLTYIWTFVVIAVASYLTLFHHLDQMALYRWDESTNALHAWEMWESGNYIVRQYQGEPDHWETKPPLLIWLQVASMRLVGFNELGVRLPSALAALATLGMMLYFFMVDLRRPVIGVFSVLALLSAQGYVRYHVVRTGDHDALLLAWLMWLLLSAYRYVHAPPEKNGRYLWFMGLALTGAVLTKSIAGFFWMPGIAIWLLLKGSWKDLIRSKESYFALGTFLLLVAGYYLLRYIQDPVYLYFVKENELFHRYLNTSVEYTYHVPTDRWLYVKMIWKRDFAMLVWLVPVGLGMALIHPQTHLRSLLQLLGLTAVIFLFAISLGTVHNWYHAPVIPLLAMMVGVVMGAGYRWIKEQLTLHRGWQEGLLLAGFLLLGLGWPFQEVLKEQVFKQEYMANDMMYGDMLALLRKHHPELTTFKYVYRAGNRHAQFYEQVYQQIYDYKLSPCAAPQGKDFAPCDTLDPGERILLCKPQYIDAFEAKYEYLLEVKMAGCRLYQVIGQKAK